MSETKELKVMASNYCCVTCNECFKDIVLHMKKDNEPHSIYREY